MDGEYEDQQDLWAEEHHNRLIENIGEANVTKLNEISERFEEIEDASGRRDFEVEKLESGYVAHTGVRIAKGELSKHLPDVASTNKQVANLVDDYRRLKDYASTEIHPEPGQSSDPHREAAEVLGQMGEIVEKLSALLAYHLEMNKHDGWADRR